MIIEDGVMEFFVSDDFETESDYTLYVLSMFICGANPSVEAELAFQCVVDSFVEEEDAFGLGPQDAYNAGKMARDLTYGTHKTSGTKQ